jgi:hypothetical protein
MSMRQCGPNGMHKLSPPFPKQAYHLPAIFVWDASFCSSLSGCCGLVSRPATSPTQPDCSANWFKSHDHISNLAWKGPHVKTARAAQTITHTRANSGSFNKTMT